MKSLYFKLLGYSRFFHNTAVTMSPEKICNDAKEIFQAAVKSVQPENLISKTVSVQSNYVHIQGKRFYLEKNVHVVGFGKAALGMAKALESILREHIVSGIISIPEGMDISAVSSTTKNNIKEESCLQIYEGAYNNIPDEKSQLAALKISELVSSLTKEDLLFVLISGGGSALLPLPKPPITLYEKIKVIKLLAAKGASIEELNAVRKKLSLLKGGGLACLAKPAKVVSLIISDIIGDPINFIASGPTVKNTDDPLLALTIINKYNLNSDIPSVVLQLLQNIQDKDTPGKDMCFADVHNFVIGSNLLALEAAAKFSKDLYYVPSILTDVISGKASNVGYKLISLITAALQNDTVLVQEICNDLKLPEISSKVLLDSISELEFKNKKICLLLGGETTVEVQGTGVGGRNQELALASAIELWSITPKRNVILLSAGTDGIDGPTDAAGALATMFTIELAKNIGLNPLQYLENNDSYTFYSKVGNGQFHVKTGHTGTNVMDIIILLIE